MFDKITEINLLYDFYAQLLTEKQQAVIRLYHCENLSLSEIGDEFSISRQGVYDTLKNAEKALAEYEAKLGLLQKFSEASSLIERANKQIDLLISENAKDKDLTKKLHDLKKVVDEFGGLEGTNGV